MRYPTILSYFTWVIMMLVAAGLNGQPENSFGKGIESYTAGDYFRAFEYFSQVVRDQKNENSETLSQAYYYRGLTRVRLYNEAFSGDDLNLQKTYRDSFLEAYKDFKAALSHDQGSFWKQIDMEIKGLHQPLLQEGLASLNEYHDQVYQGSPDEQLLKRSENYLYAAHEIRESYLVCDLLGQVSLDKGLKEEAAAWFVKSEKLYAENLPPEPDFLMAYVFYRLAAIHKTEDIRMAINDNQRGLNLIQAEYTRFAMMKDKLRPERVTELENQYQLAMHDLWALKLDLYLSDERLYVEALHVFEQETSDNPENADLWTAYASLLEKSDQEKALETYKKALSLDSSQQIAAFNIGALYYGRGKDLFETAGKTTDNKQYELLVTAAEEQFRSAIPYFEKALAAEPGSPEAIRALKTIAYILDDQVSYEKYLELEKHAGY